MPLAPGFRLGPYEILRLIGAGGMGEVYRARDTRLERTVAIKTVSAGFAIDPDRRARFEREARAVAALNHPHICALLDVGETPGGNADAPLQFLVMEYLEGHTLAERLLRGPLPASDVLRYSVELADALDHAHRRGLVHRDLKPGNVMLTESGAKLLDFGLSKVQSSTDALAYSTVSAGEAPLTAAGAVLGTYPYMSPEQLTGRDVDARGDIFAMGAIVYEMATGQRAFGGTTAATVIGAVLHTDPPPVSSLQSMTPASLDRVVSRCLAKDPDNRWQTARDLLLELKWVSDPHSPKTVERRWSKARPMGLAALAAVGVLAIAAAAFLAGFAQRTSGGDDEIRLTFAPPGHVALASATSGGQVTISPDGMSLAFVGVDADGAEALWVQRLDSTTAMQLANTDGAASPFWSPDSRFLGFFARGKLKRVAASGGPVQLLCDAVQPRGGTWNRAGTIVFAADAGRQLYRVSSAGGEATALVLDQANRESHWPDFLPDGRHFVYVARRAEPGVFVASLDSTQTTLVASGYIGVDYVEPGYLLLLAGGPGSEMAGTLMGQRFDVDRLQLVGDAVPVAENVAIWALYARAAFSASDNGRLVHGSPREQVTQLRWFDRQGKELGHLAGPGGYGRFDLAPDEKTVAVEMTDPLLKTTDIWLMDTGRGVTSRFTLDAGSERFPLWSDDGRTILFSSPRNGNPPAFFRKPSNGTGAEERVFGSQVNIQPTDTSRDGLVVFASLNIKSQWDLWVLPATPETRVERLPVPYLETPFVEHYGHLSPDGRWMAYASDESGRFEVYVGAFPEFRARLQVSTQGGVEPRWRHDGKELFYVAPDRTLTAVAVQLQNDFRAATPQPLFKTRVASFGAEMWKPQFAVSGDGQRFLINTIVEDAATPPVTVVLNWPAALNR